MCDKVTLYCNVINGGLVVDCGMILAMAKSSIKVFRVLQHFQKVKTYAKISVSFICSRL